MNKIKKRLTDLSVDECAVVDSLDMQGTMRRRLQDMGIIDGTKIKCIFRAPFGEPTAYEVRNTVIALRCEDSDKVLLQ